MYMAVLAAGLAQCADNIERQGPGNVVSTTLNIHSYAPIDNTVVKWYH